MCELVLFKSLTIREDISDRTSLLSSLCSFSPSPHPRSHLSYWAATRRASSSLQQRCCSHGDENKHDEKKRKRGDHRLLRHVPQLPLGVFILCPFQRAQLSLQAGARALVCLHCVLFPRPLPPPHPRWLFHGRPSRVAAALLVPR